MCWLYVLRVVVLSEGEPSPQSEVLSALEQVSIKYLSVLYSVHLSLDSGCFCLATLPWRSDWWSAAEMVVILEGSPISSEGPSGSWSPP